MFLREEFEANGEVYIATEDGSVGNKGQCHGCNPGSSSGGRDYLRLRTDADASCDQSICSRKSALNAIYLWKNGWHAESAPVWRASASRRKIDAHSNVHNKRDLQRRAGIPCYGGGNLMDMRVNIAGVEWKNPVTDGVRNVWLRRRVFTSS